VFLAVEDKTDADETPGQWKEVSRSLSINLDLGKGPKAGTNVLVYNNILSEAPSFAYGNQERVPMLNNITNARGAVLGELFVNATNSVMSARNYRLKETALAAIDKGISVDEFTENYVLDSDVQGITDIGAYEWGTFMTSPDTEAPSVPAADKFVVSEKGASSFRLSWQPSTDNVGVAFYEVYANGRLFKQTGDTSLVINGLTLSTTYRVAVLAVDASANRSELSGTVEAKTILNHVTILQTEVAPVTDGTLDAAYGPLLPVANVLSTAPSSAADLSGGWTSLWDANNLYIYMDVNDDKFMVDSGSAWWEDDHIELYIDANGSRPTGYTAMQYQYAVVRGASSIINAKPWFNRPTTGIVVSNVEKPNGAGYTVEIKIPFATLGVTADAYKFIGIDVQIGDDDENGGSEDTRMGWHSTINNVHQNPSLMAIAQLVEKGAGDNIKPSTPTQVRASAITPTEFLLSWAASVDNVGVLSYEVFVNGNLFATPSGTSLTLMELTPGATYAVQVVAKDRFGNLSAPSSMLRVTTPTRDSGVKYESELAAFTGSVAVSRAESGFSGTGYAVMSPSIGATITYTVTVPRAGVYPVSIVYSGDSRVFPYINGTRFDEFRLSGTPTPNDWRAVTQSFNLRAGANTIALRYESTDFWRTSNHDYILVYPAPGGDSEAPSVPADLNASNVTNRSFTLNWAASTDDSGTAPEYDVFSNGELLGSTATLTFNVTSLLPGTTYRMTVKAKDAAGSESDQSAVLFVTTPKAGAVIREFWANVAGELVSDIPVTTAPTSLSAVYSLEDPTPSRSGAQFDNFGQRMRGYIIPSASATYFFYIAADNTGELWLSTDDQPANKGTAPVVQVKNTKAREWDKERKGQKSDRIALVAGRKYYFEALMKESGGNNNLAIGWTTNTRDRGISVIGGNNIEAYVISREVANVSVTPAAHSMVTGATKVLTAIVAPEDATNPSVNWTSSNPAVATVNRMGLVTAVGIGTATITATSADGTGKTASSEITVARDWTKVDDNDANSGIVYDSNWRVWAGNNRNYKSTEHYINDRSLLSEAIFTFTGARVRYYGYTRYDLGIADVYLNGVKVATVDLYGQNGEEVYQKVLWDSGELPYGTHTVTIKATNSTNQSPNRLERHKSNNIVIDAFEYSTHAVGGCTTCRTASTSPEKRAVSAHELGLKLQPNPADRQVTIDLSGFAGESAVEVKMTDMSGKLHVSRQVQPAEAGKQVTVPVSHLPKGLFVVTVQGSKTTRRAKLVIAR